MVINVRWEEVYKYVNSLKKLDIKPSGVYGIPRGGLVLAVIISHLLDIPLLQAPCKDCIVVDDIADTGITLQHYREKGYFISTMFYHKQSVVIPNHWVFEKKDSWVAFPWEKENVLYQEKTRD